MKIKITRKDGLSIIGRKKSLTFTISSDLEQLSKASEKAFCINEVDSNEWSISYINDEMEIDIDTQLEAMNERQDVCSSSHSHR